MNYADAIYFERLRALKTPKNFNELSVKDQHIVDLLILRTTEPKNKDTGYGMEWRSKIDEVANNLKETRDSNKSFEDQTTNFKPGKMRGGFFV